MRTYHPIQWIEGVHWHDIFWDRRFWAVVAIVVFIGVLTAIVVISAQAGNVPPVQGYPRAWPYGPYGPMQVP